MRWPGMTERRRMVPELIREQIGRMVDDLLATSRARLADVGSVGEVRASGGAMIGFSPAMADAAAALKGFLRARMYTHPDVARLRDPAVAVVAGIFAAFADRPEALPDRWRATLPAAHPDRERLARVLDESEFGLDRDFGDDRNQGAGFRIEPATIVFHKREVRVHRLRALPQQKIKCATHGCSRRGWASAAEPAGARRRPF